MDRSLDVILTVAAFVVGIMLLTGHGEIFMRGNKDQRKGIYDEKKFEKASGIAFVLIGIATAIDMWTTSIAAKIAYVVILVVIVVGLIYYMKTRCRKK